MTTKTEIKKMIQEAFSGVEYPGDNDLVDDVKGDIERAEIRKDFVGKHWRDIPNEMFDRRFDSLPFLTIQAYRFYLPAYVFYSLDNIDEPDLTLDYLIYSLIPPSKEDKALTKVFNTRISSFNLQQKQALQSFLRIVVISRASDFSSQEPMQAIQALAEEKGRKGGRESLID